MRHALDFSCNRATDAVGFAAKQSHGFVLLIDNFNVVNASEFALLLNPRGGGQFVTCKGRTQKVDTRC